MKKFCKLKGVDGRTILFLTFMFCFFVGTAYLTYYAKVVCLRELPQVETVMPEPVGEGEHGRFLYAVPEKAVLSDAQNRPYLLTARYSRDIMGERYEVYQVHVWILKREEDDRVIVEGIVREEAVIVNSDKPISAGSVVRMSEKTKLTDCFYLKRRSKP